MILKITEFSTQQQIQTINEKFSKITLNDVISSILAPRGSL